MAEVKGPFFAGGADAKFDRAMEDMVQDISQTGYRYVTTLQMRTFRHPRPHYWTTVHPERRGHLKHAITDDGSVVYNHWLEGTGSRNAPVTRFAGYWTFKRTAARLRGELPRLINPHIRDAVHDLNYW